MPPAIDAPPGPTSAGMNVWPTPTKKPLVGVTPSDAPTPIEVWCVPARAYDWPNVPLRKMRAVSGMSAPTVPNTDPREKYPADP